MDAESGKVLWQKDADTPRYPASTTKIMTALLLIERCKPDEIIVAPPDVQSVTQSSLHLTPGEKVSVKDALYAIMLRSANDMSYSVGVHIAGSVPAFAKLMNDRAKQLGCVSAQFVNPHGLHDKNHKVSARDLALIAREAMRHPEFREVVRTRQYTMARSVNKLDTILVNRNRWLETDPTADGIKTGWTVPAGKCYVGSATRQGFRVITVVLKSADWKADHGAMLDWAFANNKIVDRVAAGSAAAVSVSGGDAATVASQTTQPMQVVAPEGVSIANRAIVPMPDLKAPILKGSQVGWLEIKDSQGFTQRAPLVATENVPARRTVAQALTKGNGGAMLIGGGLLVAAYAMRRKARSHRWRAF